MKFADSMESQDSAEVFQNKERRNRELNALLIIDKENFPIFPHFNVNHQLFTRKEKEFWRWDNLIHIDVDFYINDYLLNEEFLWDRTRKDASEIKQFAYEFLRESIFTNEGGLKEGIEKFTFESLEVSSECMTRKILEEITFYEKFRPFSLVKSGLFGNGSGIEDEHLVLIKIQIPFENDFYQDSFEWDISNEDNVPETFAEGVVFERKLPNEFKYLIAMRIRKQIKNYVMGLFGKFSQLFLKIKEGYHLKKKSLNWKNYSYTQKNIFATYNPEKSLDATSWASPQNNEMIYSKYLNIDNKLSQPVTFLFDTKTEHMLGRKQFREKSHSSLPSFLQNSIQESLILISNCEQIIDINKKKSHSKRKVHRRGNRIKIHNTGSDRQIQEKKKIKNSSAISIRNPIYEESNEYILSYDLSNIVISKNVMDYDYAYYFERVVIEKSRIAEYIQEKAEVKHEQIPQEETNNEDFNNQIIDNHSHQSHLKEEESLKVKRENLIDGKPPSDCHFEAAVHLEQCIDIHEIEKQLNEFKTNLEVFESNEPIAFK